MTALSDALAAKQAIEASAARLLATGRRPTISVLLGRAVKATRIVYIELDDFDLFKGKTLYQGRAEVTISVYDMEDGER